jgi:hypothetical protein
MRLRDQSFCESLIRRTAAARKLTDEVLTDAALDAYSLVNRPAALRKARVKLRKPEIQERLGTLFETVTQLDVLEAVRLHVKHIRGEIEREVMYKDSDGNPAFVKVKNAPSWPALAAYARMTLPQPAKTR